MNETVVGELTRQYTFLMLGAVGFVLLIACANVANLQFARAAARAKEVAVRAALGASRWRVVRQLLAESVLVSLLGASAGLLFGALGIRMILSNMPPDVARWIAGWNEIRLDLRVLAGTLAVALLAGITSGLAPAIQSSKPDLNETLKETGRTSTGRSRQRIRSFLVVAEMALAFILLIGAGLMVRGLRALIDLNQGFEPATMLTMQLNLPASKYKTAAQRTAFYEQALRNLESIPSVRSASLVSAVPFSPAGISMSDLTIEDRPAKDLGEVCEAQIQIISSAYFRAMHVRLREGRELNDGDVMDSLPVAVISANLAQRYWPGENPIGRRLTLGRSSSGRHWLTVVGVAADVKQHWISREATPTLYLPYRQVPPAYSSIVVRTDGDPMRIVRLVRAQIVAVDSNQPIYDVKTLQQVIAESTVGLAYIAVVMTILGTVALVLSSVGVYGVMAHSVSERTHEIGIRMALGAGRKQILNMVLGRGAGLSIGVPASVVLARMLASIIFGVSATDLTTFVGLMVILTAIALLACYIPALRAVRVSPITALRHE